jgi:hypothetical protein
MPDPPAYLDISCSGLNEDEITRIKEMVSYSEFFLDDQMSVTDREYMFHLSPFEKNEHNDTLVVQFKNEISSEFSEFNISLERNRSDPNHYGDFGYRIQIESDSDEQQLDESSVSVKTMESDYDFDSDSPEWTEFTHGDKRELSTEQRLEQLEEFNERVNSSTSETTNEPAPEIIDEWEMWYPCPGCQSIELIQVAENRSRQRATEDGSWGGQEKTLETHNYIECSDCGVVLTEWKGG